MQENITRPDTTFALRNVSFRVPGRTLLHPLSLTFPVGKVTGLIGHNGSGKHIHRWELFGPQGARAEVHFTPRLITTDMLALREAAVAGVGLVQLPVLMVKDQLAAGELVALLEGWEPRREVIHAVFPSRRGLLPSVRALVDFLTEEYARMVED